MKGDFNKLNKNNSSTPNNIENEYGIVNIIKFWYHYFNNLFKSTTDIPYPYNTINVNDIEYTNYAKIASIIKSIKGGKAICPEGISIENISHANSFVVELIMLLINNMLRYSYFPKKLILSYILPIVKNKNKSSNDSTNYRPICISNIIYKIIEKVIHNRISSLLITMDNKFGFTKNLVGRV